MSQSSICETSLRIKKGDITAENTDVIVNISNPTLNRDIGVSKAILAAAGPTLKEECARLAKLPNDGCVVTSAGNLKCKHIFHLTDAKPEMIFTNVKKVLKVCDQHKMETVSFPAIGTGGAKLDAKTSVKLIMLGIEEYLNDPTTQTSIHEIVIVVLEQNIYDIYLNFFRSFKTSYHHFSAFGTTLELIEGDITCQVADCVVNLTNNKLNRSSGVSGAILTAAGDTVKEECQRIGKAGIDSEESIKAILNSIFNYLSKTPIPTLQTISIIVFQDKIYTKYLEVFQAKSTEIQALQREETILLAISANVKIDFPLTWTDSGKSDYQEVILSEDSTEFKTVKDNFLKSAFPRILVIIEIKRIQNVKLWQSFTIKKQAIERKNPGKQNVRRLYHGTMSTVLSNISKGGFNRIYHGRNATSSGTGTYFSVQSSYATGGRYSNPDNSGNKHVFQASVITGRYTLGSSQYQEPPYINDDPNGDRYDSVVNSLERTKYFVVFYDDCAYPEYLITFKPHTP